MAMIVWRVTPSAVARASCVISCIARNTRILSFIRFPGPEHSRGVDPEAAVDCDHQPQPAYPHQIQVGEARALRLNVPAGCGGRLPRGRRNSRTTEPMLTRKKTTQKIESVAPSAFCVIMLVRSSSVVSATVRFVAQTTSTAIRNAGWIRMESKFRSRPGARPPGGYPRAQ